MLQNTCSRVYVRFLEYCYAFPFAWNILEISLFLGYITRFEFCLKGVKNIVL